MIDTDPEAPSKPGLDAALDTLDWPEFEAGPWPDVMKSKPRSWPLQGNEEADTFIRGWLAVQDAFEGRNGRYTEFRLYKLAAGGWAACVGFRSNNPGEASYWTVRPVRTIEETMDAWNWTVPAKKVAKGLGWDVRRRL